MIINYEQLAEIRSQYLDKKVVLGSGVFDLIHVAHVTNLQTLQDYGDIVVVLVKPDARIKKFKHKNKPIIPQEDRARMVDSIKGVDYVVIGHHDDSWQADFMYPEVFERLQPDTFVSSNDTWEKLQEITNAKVHVLPRERQGKFESTTSIIKHIQELDPF